MIRSATIEDATAVVSIYNPYVLETTITFEEESVAPEEMARRIADVTASLPWLVFEEGGTVLGYAYATKWRARAAYRHSVESTVYVSRDAHGRGIGSSLYRSLLEELRGRDIRAVMGGIALPNEKSVALHEKLGFRKVAHFAEVGRKFDTWLDVGYWELQFSS